MHSSYDNKKCAASPGGSEQRTMNTMFSHCVCSLSLEPMQMDRQRVRHSQYGQRAECPPK